MFLFVTLLVLLAATNAAAQATSSTPNHSEALARLWTEVGGKVIDMAEDFPEDKYNYKPTPEVRSFAEQLQHVAEANVRFAGLARGQAAGGAEHHEAAPKTKAEIVAMLKKSFEDAAAAIQSAGDAGLAQPIKLPTRTITGYGLWTSATINAAEHYGNLVVYYRLNGLVPPTTRAAQERQRQQQQQPPR
ncbi:MAG: hypothetical protein A3B65_00380 [Acidobacteria bacterium RIFCSPHIGHO2_02_FULL_67_57]|nr:MAG: hypothetical protein A3B65_00380 [Acidobacteria bacterium RIFCSPHIGHO2_02_FULL_67_57]